MRSMQWQIGILGTISAFAYRHREIKKNLCRGGRKNWQFRESNSCFSGFGSVFQPSTLPHALSKAVPLQAWSGPEGSRKLSFPDFMTKAPAAFNPRKLSWYSFLLGAESTPGPQCDRKDFMSMKSSNDTSWNRTADLLIYSTASEPLCYRGPDCATVRIMVSLHLWFG